MIKLDRYDVEKIKFLLKLSNLTHKEIADMFGVTRGHVTKIKNSKRWKNDYREKNNEEETGREFKEEN